MPHETAHGARTTSPAGRPLSKLSTTAVRPGQVALHQRHPPPAPMPRPCDICRAQPQDLTARARRLMEEVQRAAQLCGHVIADSFLQGQFDVTAKMGAYQPSSLIDYVGGRAVEVDAIFGEPLRRGQPLGLAMPELQRLYAELIDLVGQR